MILSVPLNHRHQNYVWKVTIKNELGDGDGEADSAYDIHAATPVSWVTAGVVTTAQSAKIASQTHDSSNGGVYENADYWGRGVVAYRMPNAQIFLTVFFGTTGDVDDNSLDPTALVKFGTVEPGASLVETMKGPSIKSSDTITYKIGHDEQTLQVSVTRWGGERI